MPIQTIFGASGPITHQITLSGAQSWCSDTMINGLFAEINTFRMSHGAAALTLDALGMKDAELRAVQFASYMRTTSPGTPGFNPHQGYDTTAASLGYNLVGENLAFITTNPAYVVNGVWQDPLHLGALLASNANVMGVSCIVDGGTAYWTYEPGNCSGAGCGTATSPPPIGTGSLDSEEAAFLTLINTYRAQKGLGALQLSPSLQNAARWMSADMASGNYFSHTDSLGRSTGTRLAAFGYSYTPWGENLAAGYSDAQDAFNQWQTACDPDASGACTYAHRNNMLAAGFTAIGIARAYGAASAYGWYWTTDFGGYVEQGVTNPTPTLPVIGSFSATPASLTAGQSTILSWNVTGATIVKIDSGVGDVSTAPSKLVSPIQTTTYTLIATNAAGSSTSKVTVTVAAAPDTQPPSAPVLSSAIARSSTQVDVAWTASVDNVGVTRYEVLRDGVVVARLSGLLRSYSDTSISAGLTYAYSVRASDAAGNTSPASNIIQVTVPSAPVVGGGCSTPPVDAFIGCYYSNTGLAGSPAFTRIDPQINFDWGGNTPDRSISRGNFSVRWLGNFTFSQGDYSFAVVTSDGMRLYVDGNLVLDRWYTQTTSQYTVQQTLSQGLHSIIVEYFESTGWSVAHVTWHPLTPGTTAPPSVLSFAATPSTVNPGQPATLTWTVVGASTITIDNGVGDVSGAVSQGVLPSQTTTYTLTAKNAAGVSTSRVTVAVNSVQDTQPPTPPALLSAVAKSSNEVDLVWSASGDNVAVAGYRIVRNGAAIRTVAGSVLSYADAAVSPGTSYIYSLQAYDAAGNYSAAGNSIQVTTPVAPVSGGSCASTAIGAFTGCYYSNTTLSGVPAMVRTDSQINFDWGGNPPDRSISRGGFSVRWQGSFDLAPGAYTFSALTSDGIRLYIDGSLILDKWADQAPTQYTVLQTLGAGPHIIAVEYYERSGWSSAHVSWQKH